MDATLAWLISQVGAPRAAINASSNSGLTAGAAGDALIYTGCSLTLPPGTWRVDGFASVTTTDVPDALVLSLWNTTVGSEAGYARGGEGQTVVNASLALATGSVQTVTVSTEFQLFLVPNGSSTVQFVSSATNPQIMRMLAYPLSSFF